MLDSSIGREFPILEHDPETGSIINPNEVSAGVGSLPEHAVLCFFKEAINDLHEKRESTIIGYLHSEMGKNPVYRTSFNGVDIAILHPGVGSPLAAGFLEELISHGARKLIACGGAGTLDRNISFGKVLIPYAAVRDEGTSYHYLEPGREVSADSAVVKILQETLSSHNISYLDTKTWTTDAFYRETKNKVKMRRAEGCLSVEMESAALFAVAKFRGVQIGQILYAGDDVSGDAWDPRFFDERSSIREKLLRISLEACSKL
ncbi:MAG: nucleoside phosphorylase [Thermoplasmataceae archaeon]